MRWLATFLILVFAPAIAWADCVDPPGPGVDWTRCIFDGRGFQEVDMTGARMRDATFNRGDLSNAVMVKVSASRARFVSANLTGANFKGATLREADFTNANLTNASLVEADLSRARLFRANLRGADLTGARLRGADLLDANLSGALWVDGKHRCAEGSVGQCR